MTTLIIEPGDPRDPQATALLQASHALMQSLFPAESNHYLSIDDLCVPSIHFFVAHNGPDTVGCIALANKETYGEVKSLFTDPAARGKGVAEKLLNRVEICAADLGLATLRLETGYLLESAHRLYDRQGFKPCGPFGDYKEDPNSLFMEKTL